MNATSTQSLRTKGTLFCPDCAFESPPDGEWRTVDGCRSRRLVCPDCGTVVDDRTEVRALDPQPAD